MKKLMLVLVASLFAVNTFSATDPAIVAKYNKSCIACHASGAAGAPRTGDVAAWKPRMDKGMDVMVASAVNGINAMPPKGLCFDCSADDYKALIVHMAN